MWTGEALFLHLIYMAFVEEKDIREKSQRRSLLKFTTSLVGVMLRLVKKVLLSKETKTKLPGLLPEISVTHSDGVSIMSRFSNRALGVHQS